MKDKKIYILIAIFLLLFVVISPIIIAWLGIVLAPIIKLPVFVGIIFILTVIIAWVGRVGRK
ncbi:MAG: hypothetical protein PWP16_136 [Eubacteriaceae bacterium]|jgi:hypothetical protein|nr:hypothetical protein [Eubacteriaceae bacterium]MDK2905982.1 hypothetical protein [Eubacteriaceae bacterium]MDK2937299.1 hypothetical protein [Eubacteriaceae bacterium]MDN5306773.1 hypothetical protein [Eubacteriaceae bacterium]